MSILVVDDDPAIRQSLARELRAAGWDVLTASDGVTGASMAALHDPDVILTDLAMPGHDGFHLISLVRSRSRTPIIVLSVRGAEQDKVRALDLGADDFVTKPFSVAELLARVRAQLRRTTDPEAPQVLAFRDLRIDLARRSVRQGERDIRLTPTEFSLLELLARHAGRPLSLDQIVARVWGAAGGASHDVVRVHVGSLRRKLEPDPSEPRYIVTEPWIGYRFIAEPAPS